MANAGESEQIEMMKQMVALAERQTAMSAERSEMSEMRSYHNAERTLSVWIRTALSLMIVGLAIDRFGLLLYRVPGPVRQTAFARGPLLDAASAWAGDALVLLGVIVALAMGARFLAYARNWTRLHVLPAHHGPYLAPFFAAAVALFGIVLLAIMVAAGH
jgi:putative membrane protein